MVRLLTYALLMKYGFNVNVGGRVLNPTAVFCNDREKYYSMLGMADTGTAAGLEAWCVYVLEGIRDELEKVDRLTQYGYLTKIDLVPCRELCAQPGMDHRSRRADPGLCDKHESGEVWRHSSGGSQAHCRPADLPDQEPGGAGMLVPVSPGSRQYTIGFSNNYLIRGVIKALRGQGFIPESLDKP